MKKANLPDKSGKKKKLIYVEECKITRKKCQFMRRNRTNSLKKFISKKKSWVQGKGNCILIRKQKQIDKKLCHIYEKISGKNRRRKLSFLNFERIRALF